MRSFFSRSRYEVAVPVGAPPAIFIPLYADELRKKLVSLLGPSGYDIRVEKVRNDKYKVVVLRGALSGMEAVVEMKSSLGAQPSQAEIRVEASSKTERILMNMLAGLVVLLAIPTFLLLLLALRLILALIATVIALIPLMIVCGALNAAVMSVLYKLYGNEFDSDRRVAIAEMLKQVPVPDPLAAFRGAAKQGKASAGA
ncbi:MAG TPA: hypothetical protein VK738_14890 [Terriglobales bacterium]|jgi:hypothetical protein|nr:hypothetical protein [Terriglobales bacterium]